MTNQNHPDASKNLQNRSFKGQNLNNADFSGCDIRGCDFSKTLLQGANFERVIAGQSPKKLIILIIVAVVVATCATNAIARMIFGVLGRTLQEPGWAYILALYISLGIATAASGTRAIAGRIATTISATASGALLGFFYAGTTAGNNPQIAIFGAVIGGVAMAYASFKIRSSLVAIAVTIAEAVAGYGFAFLLGANAIAFLSTHNLILGVIWSLLSLISILLVMNSLTLAIKKIKSASETSFRGADLTNAKFDGAKLLNTDFSGAIGYPNN